MAPVPRYGSETMIWREKERSRIWDVQMDNLRGLLGIRKMDKVPNAWIREFWGVKKGVGERIDGSAMCREWGMTEWLKGLYTGMCW